MLMRLKRLSVVALVGVIALGLSTAIKAAEQVAFAGRLIERSQDSTQRIEGLSWKSPDRIPIEVRPQAAEGQVVAIVEGQYRRKDWHLLGEQGRGEVIDLSSTDGSFTLRIPMSAPELKLEVMAIGPMGDLERVSYTLSLAHEWSAVQALLSSSGGNKKAPDSNASRLSFTLGAAPTLISYRESGLEDLSEVLLTMKGSAQYAIAPQHGWDAGISAFVSTLSFKNTSPDGRLIRFLGFNLRAGYRLPWLRGPWALSLLGGYYYTTTFTSGPIEFGFRNQQGPQLFPTLSRAFSSNRSASMYLKFSPVTDGLDPLSLTSSREIAGGLSYAFPLTQANKSGSAGAPSWPNRMAVSLDVAHLRIERSLIRIESSSVSLGVGYLF